ncbi:hypothetical protein PENSPDRAFT_51182 [Peniophora sp. CONT]|nr:hypothetical protein PENSPDRAFT_51182 [Peniophora sp. CONT]
MSNSTVMEEQLEEIMQDIWSVATYRMFPLLMESMLYALYTALMVSYCLRYYTQDTQRVWGIFSVTASLYLLCTSAWALDVSVLWLEMYQLLPSRLSPAAINLSIDDAKTNLDGSIHVARDVCKIITILLSDVITLWRAYVIYGRPKWLRIVCIAFVAISATLYVVNEIMISASFINTRSLPQFLVRYFEVGGGRLQNAITAMTVSTTACAQALTTVLIARKAWTHRQEIKDRLPDRSQSSRYQRLVAVLYIVIEIGLAYTCIWIFFALGNQEVLGLTAYYWANALMCQLSGMYPTLIVVVVSIRESLLEHSVQNASGLASIPIHFATANGDGERERADAIQIGSPDPGELLVARPSDEKLEGGRGVSV